MTIKKKHQMDYFQWLSDQIVHRNHQYTTLLLQLYSTDFIWSVPNDDNRLEEGLYLRELYCSEMGCSLEQADFPINCSVFEMLVALSKSCYSQSSGMTQIKVSVASWFWQLLDNCGLIEAVDYQYDGQKVSFILNRFMNREYDRNGHNGGLFPLKKRNKDQRRVELWYQMASYLNENFFYE